MKIAVIGLGSWGTAIANLLAKNGHEVMAWDRDQAVCDSVNNEKRNASYLSDIPLANICASTDFKEVLEGLILS